MPDVAMPRLSDSMEEGTILKWLKSDGDEIKRGDELVEIETDKANMTYEADQDGTLQIVAQEGDTLPVGETIARIGEAQAGAGGADREPGRGAEEAAVSAEQEVEAEAAPEPEAAPQPEQAEPAAAAQEPDAEPEPRPATATAAAPPPPPPSEPEPQQEAPAPASGNGAQEDDRVKASPIARRMAREIGVELTAVQGTGPGGRIVKADVEAAANGGAEAPAQEAPAEEAPAAQPRAEAPAQATSAEEKPAEAPAEEAPAEEKPADSKPVPAAVTSGDQQQSGRGEVTTQDLSRLQQTIARRMAESKATAPEFVLNTDVDMEAAVDLRKQLKAAAGDGPAPSFNDFVVKASALALREFPRANGAYRDGRFELYSRVNVGIAVAAQDALVVPTVFDADRKSLGQIARDARALAERVRAGAITPPELSGGTFSVSNLGMFGITSFVPVINPPQAAILGVGAMTPTPVALDGEVQIRPRMTLTLACDHRILYGADAAEFLGRIRALLEAPLQLAL
jgi:pyruvate dehydrogenase E2 component (dihydrolipoamide acetyltransferase)